MDTYPFSLLPWPWTHWRTRWYIMKIKIRLHKWFRPIMKRVLQLFGAFPSHYFDSYLFCRSDGRWYFLLFKRKICYVIYLTAKFLFTILLQFFASWKEIGHEIIILFSLSDCILEIAIPQFPRNEKCQRIGLEPLI